MAVKYEHSFIDFIAESQKKEKTSKERKKYIIFMRKLKFFFNLNECFHSLITHTNCNKHGWYFLKKRKNKITWILGIWEFQGTAFWFMNNTQIHAYIYLNNTKKTLFPVLNSGLFTNLYHDLNHIDKENII